MENERRFVFSGFMRSAAVAEMNGRSFMLANLFVGFVREILKLTRKQR